MKSKVKNVNNVTKKQTVDEIFKDIASSITSCFIFMLLIFFPLYTHNAYYDILSARYVLYKIIVIAHLVLLLGLGIIYCFVDAGSMYHDEPAIIRFFKSFLPQNIKKHIVITDVFFFAFLVVAIISTIGSKFQYESFTGRAGRFQGLQCIIYYFISYILITRTYVYKKWHFDFMLISCVFACIWGFTDFLALDIFGFLRNVQGIQRLMFTSSIGNLNTFTNYTGMGLAVACSLFCREKDIKRTIFYGICVFWCLIGCICGRADNALLSIFAIYAVLPFFAMNNRRGLSRFVIMVALIFVSFMFIYLTAPLSKDVYFQELRGSFMMTLIKIAPIRFMAIPMTLLAVGLTYYLITKTPVYDTVNAGTDLTPLDSPINAWYKKAWAIFLGLGFLLFLIIIIDFNITHNEARIALWSKIPSSNQFIFNDDWGTHRGHNWRIAMTNFADFDWFKKLFGYGPDTYLIITERSFYQEMIDKYGEIYDSAHNEYLNYLLCEGLLGLISYLGTFISALYLSFNDAKKNPLVLAAFMAVLSYLVQAVVNIAIPITSPILFTFMYLLVSTKFNKVEEA